MSRPMGHQAKADATKQGWENSDFPILCETCLGDNPYVRMTREPHGGACKICERPFTVFRWKPGPAARFKKTEICQMCAKVKHVCQTCVLDLTYGLPVEVRDSYLQHAAAKAGVVGGAGSAALALTAGASVPTSDTNRQYAIQQAERAYEQGTLTGVGAPGGGGLDIASLLPAAHEQLMRLGHNKPRYERNQARLCSFFAKGECNRGAECPFRHEMPRDKDDPLAKQNIKDRYAGADDPVAAKILGKLGVGAGGGGGGQEGGAAFTATAQRAPEPPSDPSATTLWVANVTEAIDDEELRTSFSAHGDVLSVRVVREKQCAFVEMGTRAHAEAAVAALWNSLTLRGVYMRVAWARPKAERQAGGAEQGEDGRGEGQAGGRKRRRGEEEKQQQGAHGQAQADGVMPGWPYPAYPYPYPYPYAYPGMPGSAPPPPAPNEGQPAQAEVGTSGGTGATSVPAQEGAPQQPQGTEAGQAPAPAAWPYPYPPYPYPYPYPYAYPGAPVVAGTEAGEGAQAEGNAQGQAAAYPAGYPYPAYPYPYPGMPGYPAPPTQGQDSGTGGQGQHAQAHVPQTASLPAGMVVGSGAGGGKGKAAGGAAYPSMDPANKGARA